MAPGSGGSLPASVGFSAARSVLSHAKSFLDAAGAVLTAPQSLWQQAHGQHRWLQEQEVRRLLGQMPLEKVREVSSGQLRLGGLEKSGETERRRRRFRVAPGAAAPPWHRAEDSAADPPCG